MQHQQQKKPRKLSSRQARQYFIRSQLYAINTAAGITSCTGFLLLVFGVINGNVLLGVFGVVMLCLAIIMWVFGIQKFSITDQEYDAWLMSRMRRIRQQALKDLDISSNEIVGQEILIHTFVLPGSKLANRQAKNTVRMKKGKDGQYRFSVNYITYIFPCKRVMGIFTQWINTIDMRSDTDLNRQFSAYHIVAPDLDTYEEKILLAEKLCRFKLERVYIEISTGKTYYLGAYFSATTVNLENIFTITSSGLRGQQVVMSIRRLLRQY